MTAPEPVEQEPDVISGTRLLGLAALTTFVAALGVLGSWWLARGRSVRHSPTRPAASAFAPGTPEQTAFAHSGRGLELRTQQERRLSSYGWVDREAGIARIPIERAIDLRAEGTR
jgi:hypothetical protein